MAYVPSFQPDHRLFPFESKWLESRVGAVHYIDEGEGDPILFLHGNPTWSFLYRGIVIRLRERFRCIALDYPGFGLSVRPDVYDYTPAAHAGVVTEVVEKLDLSNLTIMGQDWGGPIGLRVAADLKSRMRALVMGNTWFWPIDAWHLKSFAYVMSMAPVQSKIVNQNLFVERLMPHAVKHPMAEEVLDHYRNVSAAPGDRIGIAEFPIQLVAATEWLATLERDVAGQLADIPTLLTWGLHDMLYNRQAMERFRKSFDTCRVQRLDAKHYIQEDAPKEIASAIEDFLSSSDVAQSAPSS